MEKSKSVIKYSHKFTQLWNCESLHLNIISQYIKNKYLSSKEIKKLNFDK